MAQEVNYTPNHTGAKTRTNRMVGSISVGTDTYDMPRGTRKSYTDLTSTKTFTVEAGATVALGMTQSAGSWMNAFVYVDMDKNGFTAGIADDNYTPTGDLVSYSFYNQGYTNDENGRNSAGTSITGDSRSTLRLPNWTIPENLEPGEYRIRFKYDWCNIDPAGATSNYFGNSFTGHGGEIIDAKLVVVGKVPVTYKYSYNGDVVKTVTHTVAEGSDYPAYDLGLYGASYENVPTGKVTEETEVTINVTFSLPFEFAATYDDIDNKWYYLSIGQAAHLLYHVDNAANIALNKTEVDADNQYAYQWAFVGSPFDGYKLVNRAKGDGWVLSSSTNTFDNNTGGNTYPIMTEEPVGNGKNTYWIATASTDLGDGGFYLAQKDANDGKNKMNNRDNKLAYWNGGADHGSTFKVRHIDAIDPVTFNWAATTQWTAVDAADCTSSLMWDNKFTQGIKYIQSEIAVDSPVKGTVTFVYTDGGCRLNMTGVEVIDAEGNIVSCDYHIGFAGGAHENNIYSVKVAEAGTYTVRCYATEGDWSDEKGNHTDLFNNTNGRITANLAKTNSTEFTHDVTFAAEYATLYLGYKVAVPAGVEAYVVKSTNNGHAQMENVEGVIPANTAVILKKVGTENTYTFAYAAGDAATVEANLLKGSIANRYVTSEAYVLFNGANGIGFYLAEKNQAEGTAFKNWANKAYLEMPASSGTAAFYGFDWEGTTGISKVTTENGEVKTIYDLTGRKLKGENGNLKGVYIINGKKVLVK